MTVALHPPKAPYGTRLLLAEFDRKARTEPESPWVSIPFDENDLSKGYKDISYGQAACGINATMKWLREHMPASQGSFTSFAYVGGRDLRYPFLAIAAGKLGFVMICPSSTVTAEAQRRIMDQKDCTIFLHDASISERAVELQQHNPSIRALRAPELSKLPFDRSAEPYPYLKTWEEAKDDPWLVFHTSGTTGFPKVVTYSQSQWGSCDVLYGLEGIKKSYFHHYKNSRWLSPMPLLHASGMSAVLTLPVFCNSVPALCPTTQTATVPVIKAMLQNTNVSGANMSPAMIDALCADPVGLSLLKKLNHIHYIGAPLGQRSGSLLSSHVTLAPAIGSTDGGPYFVEIINEHEDWDYVSFQPHAGAVFEPRMDNLHELVFIKDPKCALQPVFRRRPELTRFETNDLWIEHSTKKGQWKIVGRTDDYVAVAGGGGLFVAPLEPILREHPLVQIALVGGHGRPKPVILLELKDTTETLITSDETRAKFMGSFQPFIDRANLHCHESVKLDSRLVVFATKEKPLARTVKDTVSRPAALKQYEDEIDSVYQHVHGL